MFFYDLESSSGLNIDDDDHTWLLHHLFLDDINGEITQWSEVWNNHKISTPGVGNLSPKAMKLFSIVTHGIRGVVDIVPDNAIEEYGIDWEDFHNDQIHHHHDQHNDTDYVLPDDHTFTNSGPAQHTVVNVEEPSCPLTAIQLSQLNNHLNMLGDQYADRKLRWILALGFCKSLDGSL